MSVYELSGLQRDLLFVIAGSEDPSGQEIGSEIERTQNRTLQHGRLYSNLDALVEVGFVEKWKNDGRTNSYGLTREGKAALAALLEWQNEMRTE